MTAGRTARLRQQRASATPELSSPVHTRSPRGLGGRTAIHPFRPSPPSTGRSVTWARGRLTASLQEPEIVETGSSTGGCARILRRPTPRRGQSGATHLPSADLGRCPLLRVSSQISAATAQVCPGRRSTSGPRKPCCSYTCTVTVATTRSEVGVRDLKNNLSRYLDRVQLGEEIIVTEHGKPVARLSSLDQPSDRLGALIASGAVRAPRSQQRQRPVRRIKAKGSVSDLVAEQRR